MKLIIINLLIAYIILLLFAYFASNVVIFQPPSSGYKQSSELIKLKTADGERIVAYYFPNEKAKYTLLVSHGNAEDIGTMLPFLHEMHSHGFSVFAYDYHGYGLSSGKPNEDNVYLDIDAAYDYLINTLKILPQNIIAYGHSLGAAVTLDLAVRKPVAGVILQGAFISAFRVITSFSLIPFDKFNNFEKIKLLKSPLLIIHGTSDHIIPFWHGKKLYEKALGPKQFCIIDGAGHNNVVMVGGDKYWYAISNFIKQNVK